jgi:hypothetical protein
MTDVYTELSAFEARVATRGAMLELAELLTIEFDAVLPADDVIRSAYRTRETLLAQGLRLGVVEATATATRRMLRDPVLVLQPTLSDRQGS